MGFFLSPTSLPLRTAFTSASLLVLQPHSSSLVLPKSSEPRERLVGWIWRALLSSAGQSFPAVWVFIEWSATVMLRYYWFCFIFFNATSYTAPQNHSRVTGCPVVACFCAVLSSTVATCWKHVLVPVYFSGISSHISLLTNCAIKMVYLFVVVL